VNIKIGGIIYSIVYTNQFDDEFGRVDRLTNTIYISNRYPKNQQDATLIHEILHQINSELPEREVEALAQAIYQIINDNEWIGRGFGASGAIGKKKHRPRSE